ncbi:hypothetical protein HG531_004901 [Fusarium graminearum]|nr:hypothetical protein HG531_004901 [Fusarium graminearum]
MVISSEHSLHLTNDNFRVRCGEHAQNNNGTSSLSTRDLALLDAVNLPQLVDNNLGNHAALHHRRQKLLKRSELRWRGAKGQTDHVSRNVVGSVVGAEGVRGLEEKPLVAFDQMCLNTLAFVAVALGPDETKHTSDTDLVLLNVLTDDGSGLVNDFDELNCFVVVSPSQGELLDGLAGGSLLLSLLDGSHLVLFGHLRRLLRRSKLCGLVQKLVVDRSVRLVAAETRDTRRSESI